MLTRCIAATVRSTASLIALSAQASVCWLCICSANSAMRFCSSSGSPKSPPKPSMASSLGRRRALGPARRDDLLEGAEAEDPDDRHEAERERERADRDLLADAVGGHERRRGLA